MRVVNVSDVEQVVMAVGITAGPGEEVEWPDDLPLPATFAPAGLAQAAEEEATASDDDHAAAEPEPEHRRRHTSKPVSEEPKE